MTTKSRPDHGNIRPRSTVWISAALVLGAVAYLGVPLEMAFGGALDRSTSYLSENAALDQPHSAVFRVADALAGLAVGLACVLIWRRRTSTGLDRAVLAGVAALGVFALGTVADAVFVLRCAPSISEACRVADAQRSLGIAHQIHVVTSVTGLAGVTVSAVLVCAALRRRGTECTRRLRVSILVAASAVVGTALVVTAAAIVDQLAGGLPEGAGYVQRGQTVAISAYLCVLAVGVRRRSTDPVIDTSPRKVLR